jgi:2-dehydro-3-deoxyphosphogluconate aldolase / (4S)-4-hydroxy-2-oxoglutarate aldolase
MCMKSRSKVLHELLHPGIIAVIRADSSNDLLEVAHALKKGGVTAMEVTMTTPNAIEVIKQVTEKFGNEILMGVGTVLDAETCRHAILAGAEFVVTPIMRKDVIELCRRYARPVMIGAYTPTEMQTAWEAGADFVKLFPADSLGPNYIKSIKAPLPHLEIVPTGGVTPENVHEFIMAGAAAVGAGSSLVSKKALQTKNWDEITATAQAFVKGILGAKK